MAWQSYQQPFIALQPGTPSPAAAAALGLIPGVGAMFNGQFIKGFIHVVIFAVLVYACDFNGLFGIFIAAWIVYQSFEAYYTARALRDGQPLPDPLGLNEVDKWFNPGARAQNPEQPGPAAGQASATGIPQPPYQAPYQQAPPPGPFAPPVAPVPPMCWRRREPIGAIVLISLGLLFLLQQFNLFAGRVFEFTWPLLLIGLGVWLIVRRLEDSQGGRQ
jgi:hypothetical protein